jgi:DNA-3-methyladenine glycosylase I
MASVDMSSPSSSRALSRCRWVRPDNALYVAYHDEEWGRPCHDERRLFELLNLEGMQAGLSWETVLKKREAFRKAYDDWDASVIAGYDDTKILALMADAGTIRNRLKIRAVIANAQAYLTLLAEGGSLDALLWAYVDHCPLVGGVGEGELPPAKTALSETISKDLTKRGFRFVGPTIIYAYMQAIGMVNDHDAACFLHLKASEPNAITL